MCLRREYDSEKKKNHISNYKRKRVTCTINPVGYWLIALPNTRKHDGLAVINDCDPWLQYWRRVKSNRKNVNTSPDAWYLPEGESGYDNLVFSKLSLGGFLFLLFSIQLKALFVIYLLEQNNSIQQLEDINLTETFHSSVSLCYSFSVLCI